MKYLILCFAVGFILGALSVYIWKRTHTVGALKIYDQEGEMSPAVFMELECDLPELRAKKVVSLRVENPPLYEN